MDETTINIILAIPALLLSVILVGSTISMHRFIKKKDITEKSVLLQIIGEETPRSFEIVYEEGHLFGTNPLLPKSVIAWKPLKRRG